MHDDSLEFLRKYMRPSGEWRDASTKDFQTWWNPRLPEPPKYSQQLIKSANVIDHHTHFADLDLHSYASAIKEAAVIVRHAKPDVILVPMRGGVRPWQHLRIFCDIPITKGKLVPFSVQEKYLEETKAFIGSILNPLHGREKISIVCIDVGKGGQGSARMVDILKELHLYDRESFWDVSLVLFVPEDRKRAKWGKARENGNKRNFKVECHLLGVSKVVGEDLDAGMIIPSNVGKHAQFTMRIEGRDYIIESTEVPRVLDQKIAESIHYSLLEEKFTTVVDIKAKPHKFDSQWGGPTS